MEEDRISDLPDCILEHVLCFVSSKEAARCSILSKRWRRMNLSSTLPVLNFINYFYDPSISKNFRKKNRRLLNFVSKILLARSRSTLKLQKLSLKFLLIDTYTGKSNLMSKQLQKQMTCVSRHGVTSLNLSIESYCEEGHSDFLISVLEVAQSLKDLFLSGFNLTSLATPDFIGFSSLRNLKLWVVELDDDAMNKLLKGSPLLEILELESIEGLKNLQVKGLHHMKMLSVQYTDIKDVQIDAVTLEVLKLDLKPDMITMATCAPYLRQFEIKGRCLLFEYHTMLKLQGLQLPIEKWFSKFFSECCLLEHLTLVSVPLLHSLHITTPLLALKTLHLIQVEDMTSLHIVAPNLEKLLITAYTNLPFVEVNASDKLEVEVKFDDFNEFDGLWHDRLANFLGYFNYSKAVKLSPCYGNEKIVIPKITRNKLSSPLYNTKHLEFSTCLAYQDALLFSEYMDYMLWLSPRATNLTINVDGTKIVFELLYEEKVDTAIEIGCCAHCMLIPLKCWRHHLKDVKIQEFFGEEARKEDVKHFLWEEIGSLRITEKSLDPDSVSGALYASYDQLFIDSRSKYITFCQVGHN